MPPDPTPKYKLARKLRAEMSPPEVRLWLRLRSRKETGITLRRQHPMGPYVLDFYCPQARLAIEVDGAQHTFDDAIIYDARRDKWFADNGIETLRVPAIDIMQDADAAADGVMAHIHERLVFLSAID
jgi:very-short-patch-repair endonuclease